MTDLEIVEHMRDHRFKRAIKGLYSIYPAVKKLVLVNKGAKEDAEDIFQEALLVLYKKVQDGHFELSASLKTYLTAVSRNLWYQELRRRNKEIHTNEFVEVEALEDENEQIFRQAEMAFNLLGEKCRELLIRFYYKKQSMQTIAALLGFSNERVAKNQKYRCLEKAKDHFIQLKGGKAI